ncbi:MAG: ATP-binding cassette domain-containing protein [Oscillatoriaceae bacterium SKW80]|nr:ATP-binding cassette domain-containing protein [Oscillatoriaceae bacterium SKYG93]MCX8122084.1 ATP-binding cassette domain-containing protein [Oscillatoriaceae bacterium SKW80]MDW8454371.1 ATP-binding cassette domain-containing protein [Oscillatoriaceae cyanobacterium SKYGB_i_bin93]HIK29235.1 ATP-binding cassette domain-containing protein [Oscillatoriaceae cyanobacterium M7585_C2015_266]
MAKVTFKNVYKSFPARKGGKKSILRDINLEVEDGQFLVLVGPSGCGKSTLLRLLAGLEEITAGEIYIGERLVNNLPPKQRDIAMVFQNYALYPHLTVYDNIAFGLRRANRGGKEWGKGLVEDMLVAATRAFPKGLRYISEKEKAIEERVRAVAKLLQIDSLLERLPKQLSGGQKQRVALGRAIARNPQVFLMDEPLSNLDAKLRTETRAQIVKLQRQLGTTTIYVTHDQTEALTMGERIAVMHAGQIQQVAQPLELYSKPANRFVAEFIGSPPMNFLPVQFQAPLLVVHPQFRLTLPEVWAPVLRKYDGRELILGIRPEHLSLSLPASKNLQVQVELVEALGHETYLSVRLIEDSGVKEQQRIQVRVDAERCFRLGEKIWIAIAPDKLHLFDPDTGATIFP